jgi:predicted phage tail protein
MIRTVHLHGKLGECFGATYRLDVVNPAEAVRALVVLLGHDFERAIRQGEWHVVAGESLRESRDYGTEELCLLGLGQADLHIAPAASGASGGGIFKALLGVALLATAIIVAPPVVGALGPTMGMQTAAFSAFGMSVTYANIATAGVFMGLSGVSQMLSSTPQLTSGYTVRNDTDDQPSFLFNGPKNTSEQGGPVPILYGLHETGWTLISAGTHIEQIEPESGGRRNDKPDTLQSRATMRMAGIIGEGENVGLELDARSILFGGTPLMAEDGSYNFEGVSWWERKGTADQEYIPGFPDVESEVEVGAEVSSSTPVVRTITSPDVDAARVRLRFEGLLEQDGQGNIGPYTVNVAIDIRQPGGEWTEAVTDAVFGKASGAYERAYRIELPGDGPWDIRVRKVTQDANTLLIKDTIKWAALTEITDLKMTYPYTHYICLALDSELFGGSIPTVSFRIKGKIVDVPVNYDPVARTYNGAWDGTFKQAWTDNPAWCVRDIIVNDRYGLGIPSVDKWGLYQISQYNDGMVDDGYGGQEPRFTLNVVLQTQEEAYDVIAALGAAMRAMSYWASGAVAFSQDSPALPSHEPVCAANVEHGIIKHKGTARKARHSVAFVTWNDPADNYRPAVVVYEDPKGIAKYGWNPKHSVLVGCTSRGQALRMAKWEVWTELYETDVASWVSGLDYADAVPGVVVPLADQVEMGVPFGGRLKAASATQVTLDRSVTIDMGETYTVTLTQPDLTSVDRVLTNAPGTTDTLTWDEPLTNIPQVHSIWALTATHLVTPLYRMVGNVESDKHKFELMALIHRPEKFAVVEQGIKFDPAPSTALPTGSLAKPGTLSIDEFFYGSGEALGTGVILSWVHAANDERVVRYEAQMRPTGGLWESGGTASGNSLSFKSTETGSYDFRVRSISSTGQLSKWTEVLGLPLYGMNQPPNDVTGVVLSVSGRDNVLSWEPVVDWRSVSYEIRKGTSWNTGLFVARTSELSRPVGGADGTYMIAAYAGGAYSDNPTMAVVDGGVTVANVLAVLDESGLEWPGSLSGDMAVNEDGNLWLNGIPVDSGTYQIAPGDVVSLSSAHLCNVQMDYDVYANGAHDDVYEIPDIYAVDNIYGVYADYITVLPEMRLYKSGAWGEWTRFIPGDYAAERFDFRIRLSTSSQEVSPVLTRLVIAVDVPDRNETGRGLVVDTDGLDVTYGRDFNATPTVVCQVVNAQGGEDVVVSNESVSGFNVTVNVDGLPVERTINFIAQGY